MFRGFSQATIHFLRELEIHNNREWFRPRKAIFEQEVRRPMEALVEACNGVLIRLAPGYMTEPSRAIFRIYRDTRFFADKRPDKTQPGAWFGRAGIPRKSAAEFYFHLSSKDFLVAGGCYQPTPDQRRAIRQHLLVHHQRFRKLTTTAEFERLVQLPGEILSREPKGFPKDHPAGDLIRQKQWGWHASLPLALAQSPGLIPEIGRCFETLAPMVEFLNEPFLRPAHSKRGIFIRLSFE